MLWRPFAIQKKEFFGAQKIDYKADTILHSHVLEHFYTPVESIKEMADITHEGGHMMIAVPLIDIMLEDKLTNAMNFEHTYMTSLGIIEKILNMNLRSSAP